MTRLAPHLLSLRITTGILLVAQCFSGQRCFAAEPSSCELSAHEIASLIDERLHVHDSGTAVAFADDATFLRRVTLDLASRIPTIAEVREFLEDTSPTKRLQAVDRLANSGAHLQTMATFWRRAWVPQADTIEFAGVADDFDTWLAQEMQRGTRYDRLVSEVIAWNEDSATTAAIDPRGFYVANESTPANLAASATRAFLGINLDCARCHDHPNSRWTREQFWQTAAFFAEPQRDANGLTRLPKLKIPDGELEFKPELLSEVDVAWPKELDTVALKSVLADWMLTEDQRYLGRNAVNRLWSHFFGEALIEPIDDLSSDRAQSGPRAELLNELAEVLIHSGYDTELLIRAIALSDAYRLASRQTDEPDVFTKPDALVMTASRVRGLSAEQLYNSLRTAAGIPPERTAIGNDRRNDPRQAFVLAFHVERSHEAERSVSQALTMLNGSFTNGLSTTADNRMLAAVLASPFMSFDEQIDTVFVAVLGRHANDAERQVVLRHAELRSEDGSEDGHPQCLADLYWALINSPEFNTNH